MVKTLSSHKVVIGRAEPLYLVGYDNQQVPAKIDSGAYRSAMHATNIAVKDGVLSCVLLSGHPMSDVIIPFSTKNFKKVTVTNSFGEQDNRYEIKLRVKLGPKIVTVGFTLADRSKNIYPVLVGRTFLNKRFMIDTSRIGVDRRELKKRLGTNLPEEENEETV
jgi:hypothetical protein